MLPTRANTLFKEIKNSFENCVNNSHLDVAIDYYSRQLNQLLKEYPKLHLELMEVIKIKRGLV